MAAILLVALQLATTPSTSEWAQFIGFSADERLAAYRHDVHERRADGSVDQYSLVQTVDVASGYPVATFKASAIHRIDAAGKITKASENKLARDNQRFAKAYPAKRWKKLQRRSRFSKRVVALTPETFNLQPDPDMRGNFQNEKGVIMIAADSGSPIGFHGALVGVEGTKSAAAKFEHVRHRVRRHESLAAQVSAFRSKTGHAVALVTLFLVTDQKQARGVPVVQIVRADTRTAPSAVAVQAESQDGTARARTYKIPQPKLRLDPKDRIDRVASAQAAPPPVRAKPVLASVDPWKMRVSPADDRSALAAMRRQSQQEGGTTRQQAQERGQIDAIYSWFVGDKKNAGASQRQ